MELLCGVDEAGRGPLAGPVTAAAVILPDSFPVADLRDSKRLSAPRREALATVIRSHAISWAVGWASHGEIDALNILRATMLAMQRAVLSLDVKPTEVVVDGLQVPDLQTPVRAVVKADATIPAVMAASILAKTARDRWMVEYAVRDPRYGFDRHMGYPTREHRERIRLHGRSPIHRRSFRVS